jgi:ComF family protein
MNKRWFCEVNENGTGIKVFKGRVFQGIYKFITTDYCRICGEIGVKTENCPWHKEVYGYKRLYLIGKYYTEKVPEDELLTKHITEFKTKREYAFPLGKALALVIQRYHPWLLKYDFIVPVPIHIEKEQITGYNRMQNLAKVVCHYLQMRTLYALQKNFNYDIKKLPVKERREKVREMYDVREGAKREILNKKIILLDDIITTGTTLSECSYKLLKEGAKEVVTVALAKSVLKEK